MRFAPRVLRSVLPFAAIVFTACPSGEPELELKLDPRGYGHWTFVEELETALSPGDRIDFVLSASPARTVALNRDLLYGLKEAGRVAPSRSEWLSGTPAEPMELAIHGRRIEHFEEITWSGLEAKTAGELLAASTLSCIANAEITLQAGLRINGVRGELATASADCTASVNTLVVDPSKGIASRTGSAPLGFTLLDLALQLQVPDQQTLDATARYLVILRRPQPGGAGAQCRDIWTRTESAQTEGLAIFPRTENTGGRVLSPVPSGWVTVLVYALGEGEEGLCQTNGWCTAAGSGDTCEPALGGVRLCSTGGSEPPVLAGGCATSTLTPGMVPVVGVMMQKPPR